MNDIDKNNIRRLDGGTLLIFRELLLRRRASDVAVSLGLSQSAISHALARLRDLFGDPLFIRKSHGLEPTERALDLGPHVDALIELAGALLSPEGAFNPFSSTRCFRIAAPDYIVSMIGGALAHAFAEQAPRAAFSSRRLLVGPALAALRRGEVDIALGQFGVLPPQLEGRVLYEDSYCVVARKRHPRIKGRIDPESYAEVGHIFVGDPAMAQQDGALYDMGEVVEAYGTVPDRQSVATRAYVSHWETALLTVSMSDMLADCPRRFAERFAGKLGLQILDPPYEAARFPVLAVRRAGIPDLGVDWLSYEIEKSIEG